MTPRTDRETYIITARDIGFRAVSPRLCKELEEEIEKMRDASETVHLFLVERALEAEKACNRVQELHTGLMKEADRRYDEMMAERNLWKNNHDQMVQRNAVLRERPDLPVDRLPAIARYEARIAELEAALKKGSQ